LVQRHGSLVYAAALRHLQGNTDLARDVTQLVFIDLAIKAGSLRRHRSLAGWLYTSARFAAAKLVRAELRRVAREQEAIQMDNVHRDTTSTNDPARLKPLIDDAI